MIILVNSGAFNPGHQMHLKLMEMVASKLNGMQHNGKRMKVVGGVLVPSPDEYIRKKTGCVMDYKHR